MDIDCCLEQQWRKDDVVDEIMRQPDPFFDVQQCKSDAGNDKPDRERPLQSSRG